MKRWRLARVLAHLAAKGNGRGTVATTDPRVKRMLEADEELVCTHLYPAMIGSSHFRGLTINYLREDLGIDTVAALRAYQVACLGLCYGIAQFFATLRDALDDIEREEIPLEELGQVRFVVPASFEELKRLGPERYAARHWPDDKAA